MLWEVSPKLRLLFPKPHVEAQAVHLTVNNATQQEASLADRHRRTVQWLCCVACNQRNKLSAAMAPKLTLQANFGKFVICLAW
eukprot:1225378-Amphidinium_carterae.1